MKPKKLKRLKSWDYLNHGFIDFPITNWSCFRSYTAIERRSRKVDYSTELVHTMSDLPAIWQFYFDRFYTVNFLSVRKLSAKYTGSVFPPKLTFAAYHIFGKLRFAYWNFITKQTLFPGCKYGAVVRLSYTFSFSWTISQIQVADHNHTRILHQLAPQNVSLNVK